MKKIVSTQEADQTAARLIDQLGRATGRLVTLRVAIAKGDLTNAYLDAVTFMELVEIIHGDGKFLRGHTFLAAKVARDPADG